MTEKFILLTNFLNLINSSYASAEKLPY